MKNIIVVLGLLFTAQAYAQQEFTTSSTSSAALWNKRVNLTSVTYEGLSGDPIAYIVRSKSGSVNGLKACVVLPPPPPICRIMCDPPPPVDCGTHEICTGVESTAATDTGQHFSVTYFTSLCEGGFRSYRTDFYSTVRLDAKDSQALTCFNRAKAINGVADRKIRVEGAGACANRSKVVNGKTIKYQDCDVTGISSCSVVDVL